MYDLMENIYNQELMKLIRETNSKTIAEELVSVQPMDPKLISDLYKAGKDKEWLEKNNYKPVSSLGLLYVKEEDINGSD